jgi:hypothetical protein
MKVKLLVGRASADFSQNAGDVVDVDINEGARMIEAGQAVPVIEQKTERAVKATAAVERR